MNYPKAIVSLFYRSRDGFLRNVWRTTAYYLRGKSIVAHHRSHVKGISKISIETGKTLNLGLFPNEFGAPSDVTFLNVRGRLTVNDNFHIGRGARISIGKEGSVTVNSGFINNYSILAIEHSLVIGKDTAIGWNVQIIDDDFHALTIEGASTSKANDGVAIGNHVWIGSNVNILKNVVIPDGCVVASDSLVNQKFSEPNCLIGGSPAKILKRNVQWR
jgi:acetyltransferase-like isoleucine patch superfamily enzyme